MKVIDLLNKIANGEEVPKKIRYKTFEMKRTKSEEVDRLYVDEQGDFFPEYYSFGLNDEIEIIEENKKIEKVSLEIDTFEDSYYDTALIKLANKIDEIIDKVNEISNGQNQ